MKATLYRNIDLVQIPLKAGVKEYFFPQNVDWAGKKIDRLSFCFPDTAGTNPVDGTTPYADTNNVPELYLSLYNANEKELMHEVFIQNLVHLNNNPVEVHDTINLSLSRMVLSTAPASDMTMLIYVYWGSVEKEDYDMPMRSVTAVFPMDADQELTFQEIINQYVHALPGRIKAITAWDTEINPAYITLRDTNLTYIFRYVHTELMRPSDYYLGTGAEDMQEHGLLLDDIDIDFDYSRIRNASNGPILMKLTLYF